MPRMDYLGSVPAHAVPPPVSSSSGVLLGAQMERMHLAGQSQDQVAQLMANHGVMYRHQMELHRKQQLEAAKFKVSQSVSKS